MIFENLSFLRNRIQEICDNCGRNSKEIMLVGVTKYARADQTKEAVEAGIEHIGENRVVEASIKFKELGGLSEKVTKHMIGHLQTNKVKKAVEVFNVIQSVDSSKLMREVESQAGKIEKHIDVLIQVNVSAEQQKSGCTPEKVYEILDDARNLEFANIKGLMAMAPLTDDREAIRQCFTRLRKLKDDCDVRYKHCDNILMKYLSMGMSQDFDIAIEEGSNMIRIGGAIFKND